MKAAFLWALLAWLIPGFVMAAPLKTAYVPCGGTANYNETAVPLMNKTGMHGYLAIALELGPKLRKAGYERVIYHNPFGITINYWPPKPTNIYADPFKQLQTTYGISFTREMWPDQFTRAERSGLKMADREDWRLGVELLRNRYGIKEIIAYLGSPECLQDPFVEGRQCVDPILVPGVSICWDNSVAWVSGDATSKLFDSLRKDGHKVYVEPRLSAKAGPTFNPAGQHEKHVDGTFAMADYDLPRGEDMAAAAKYGEVIRGTHVLPTSSWPAGVTAAINVLEGPGGAMLPGDWHQTGGNK